MSDNPSTHDSFGWHLAGVVLVAGLACFFHTVLVRDRFAMAAAFYVGLPTLIAMVVALLPTARGAAAAMFKFLTVFVLISEPILGVPYVVMFYLVPLTGLIGLILGMAIDDSRASSNHTDTS